MASESEFKKKLAEFYSQEENSIKERYNLVEKIIGMAHHNPSVGAFCESIIREYLRKNLPRDLSVDSGFIYQVHNRKGDIVAASPQIDIIIHEDSCCAPILRAPDFVVVDPNAVQGVIEVKKTLTKTNLYSAIENIDQSYALACRNRSENSIFTGIFAFSSDIEKKAIFNSIQEAKNHGLTIPKTICILKKHLIINKENDCFWMVNGEVCESEGKVISYSLQCFLYELLDVMYKISGKNISRFSFDLEKEEIIFKQSESDGSYSWEIKKEDGATPPC